MKLGAIHIYPVKGGRGLSPQAARLEPQGLAGDRRWMVVDEAGEFVTQREMPALALLDVQPDADGLHLSMHGHEGDPDGGERFVPTPDGSARGRVFVWESEVDAALADEATNAALSRWFGRPLRLAYMDVTDARGVNRDWSPAGGTVSFADGFPLLVATTDSLRALNRTIVAAGGEAVPMSRFRPNLVVDDAEGGAWAEDNWAAIRVGDAVFDLVKPCARCTVTTVDQNRGVFDGPQPIEALRQTRFSGDRRVPGVLFGWNAVPREAGATLSVGDAVEVLAPREAGWPLRAPRSA